SMVVTSGDLIRHYHAFSHHNKGRPIYIHISKGNRVFQKVFIYLNGNVFARFDLFYSYMV
ncbi:hypothetical protein ACEODH_27990, partial [Klebsiella pneumoniae]|uniref:hypothetical protein n=1 Tax=Klebsiella pneumoniae TaxID=573 RepID=UPI0039C5D0DE